MTFILRDSEYLKKFCGRLSGSDSTDKFHSFCRSRRQCSCLWANQTKGCSCTEYEVLLIGGTFLYLDEK